MTNTKTKKLPLISVIMLNWNGLEDSKVSIAALRKSTYPNFEIIIVDNGSVDGSKEWLRSQEDILLVDLEKNYGVTGGHNKGYEASHGELIANLNNDTVVDKDWLWALYRSIAQDETIAATGGKAYEWNDEYPAYDESNPFFSYQVIDLFGGYAYTMRAGDERVSINSISTVGALMRRSAIEKVGYFDNDFFAYYDETDQFARFKRAGYKIMYTPEAKLWHSIGGSTKGVPYFYLYHMHRNRFMFAVKNYDREYLGDFLRIYTRDSLGAMKAWLRGSKDLNEKARVRAFLWNIVHFHRSFKKRKSIMTLGPTYNKLLSADASQYVSVVITCYNYGEYIQDAIESALKQTVKPLEIIVINDGSTDDSLSKIKKYKDQVTIINKKNEGVIAAKNQGLLLSRGEWIIYLDADDTLEPTYIEETLKYAREHNDDVVYTDMRYVGSKNSEHVAGKFAFGRLLEGNFIHNSSLYRKSKLHQAGAYKPVMRGGYEDWEINISLHEVHAKFGYLSRPLLNYRQHGHGTGRNNKAKKQAKALIATVKRLHRRSYIIWGIGFHRPLRAIVYLKRHPLYPLVIVVMFPVAILKGIYGGLRAFKHAWVGPVRHYIHARELKRKDEV